MLKRTDVNLRLENNAILFFSTRSLVHINSFNGTGPNCKIYSRIKCDYDEKNNIIFMCFNIIEMNARLFF